MITKTTIRKRLEKMGETSTDVAIYMAKNNVVGRPGNSSACPIHNALGRAYPKLYKISVGLHEVFITPKRDGDTWKIPLPRGANDFRLDFDQDRFPKLQY